LALKISCFDADRAGVKVYFQWGFFCSLMILTSCNNVSVSDLPSGGISTKKMYAYTDGMACISIRDSINTFDKEAGLLDSFEECKSDMAEGLVPGEHSYIIAEKGVDIVNVKRAIYLLKHVKETFINPNNWIKSRYDLMIKNIPVITAKRGLCDQASGFYESDVQNSLGRATPGAITLCDLNSYFTSTSRVFGILVHEMQHAYHSHPVFWGCDICGKDEYGCPNCDVDLFWMEPKYSGAYQASLAAYAWMILNLNPDLLAADYDLAFSVVNSIKDFGVTANQQICYRGQDCQIKPNIFKRSVDVFKHYGVLRKNANVQSISQGDLNLSTIGEKPFDNEASGFNCGSWQHMDCTKTFQDMWMQHSSAYVEKASVCVALYHSQFIESCVALGERHLNDKFKDRIRNQDMLTYFKPYMRMMRDDYDIADADLLELPSPEDASIRFEVRDDSERPKETTIYFDEELGKEIKREWNKEKGKYVETYWDEEKKEEVEFERVIEPVRVESYWDKEKGKKIEYESLGFSEVYWDPKTRETFTLNEDGSRKLITGGPESETSPEQPGI
jgi:hypothetical protein